MQSEFTESSTRGSDLEKIYDRRFVKALPYRDRVWQVLTGQFFSRWTSPTDAVLDLGCGFGQFINNIKCARKFAMDLNPRIPEYLAPNVVFLHQDCSDPWNLADESLDLVFTSNFLEHLPTKSTLTRTVQEAWRCLKPGGRFIAMGPNVKHVPGAYWDFFDHHLALTEMSVQEVLELTGFQTECAIARFMPFTMVNQPEYPLLFLRAYLGMPFVWRWFGGQFLVVVHKPSRTGGSSKLAS